VLCATPRAAKGRASTTNLAEALVGAQTTDVRSACASAATVDALEGNAAGYQIRVRDRGRLNEEIVGPGFGRSTRSAFGADDIRATHVSVARDVSQSDRFATGGAAHLKTELGSASPNLASSELLESFNAKGNVDANSPSKADRCSSRRFSINSRSASGRSVWSSLRQRQMSFRTDLISLKLSSIVVIADANVIQS
jgi:hypothetical protein